MRITDLLATLEAYYDTVPRAFATTEEIGPLTLFVRSGEGGHPYYARPRLGLDAEVTVHDVLATLARQDEIGVPRKLEWVDETTPTLLPAVREAGLDVEVCPILVLDEPVAPEPPHGYALELMPPDSRHLGEVVGAVDAGFAGSEEVAQAPVGNWPDAIERGLTAYVGAFELEDGELGRPVGGGSHSPRGETTELMGIAVLPSARRRGLGAAIAAELATDAGDRGVTTCFLSAQDDAVARVYERVGFRRVATACIVG